MRRSGNGLEEVGRRIPATGDQDEEFVPVAPEEW